MVNTKEELISIEKHTTFYAIAHTSFQGVRRLASERDKLEGSLGKLGREVSDDERATLSISMAEEERAAVATVVFSALTLEAFINHYAINRFSGSFFDKYLESLRPIGKWLIIPRLANAGKTVKTEGQAFQGLIELFELRNKLVHFKSTKKPENEARKDRITKSRAEEAIETVHKAVTELKTIDEKADIAWLSEAGKSILSDADPEER